MKHSWTAFLFGLGAVVATGLATEIAAGHVPIPASWSWLGAIAVAVLTYVAKGLPNE